MQPSPSQTPGPGQYGENSPNATAGGKPVLTYVPNGTGGVNYFANGAPTTREFFQMNGQDPDSIEASAATAYKNSQASTTPASTQTQNTTTGGSSGSTATPSAAEQGILDSLNADRSLAATNTNSNADLLLNGPNGILNVVSALKAGQSGIDQQRVQDSLAKTQGLTGVLNMVNHGIQSGGVQLANSNASNSSAAEALARAYGIQGRNAASQVGNQYAIDENKADVAQTNQDQQAAAGVRSLQSQKTQAINNIVGTATQQIAQLSSLAGSLGVTGKVNLDNEIQTIRNNALAALSQYDSQIAGATPTALGAPDVAAQASNLATAGTAAAAPYDYTTTGPAQLQGTGPQPTELPIFTTPVKKTS